MSKEKQEKVFTQLESRLNRKLTRDDFNDDLFTIVDGVTVKIGPRGGIDLPAVRTYHMNPFKAALKAGELFGQQRERDDSNPELAAGLTTGHFNPIWLPRKERCDGDRVCPRCS